MAHELHSLLLEVRLAASGQNPTMLKVILSDRRRRGWAWQVPDQSGSTLVAGRRKTK
jgi:hypothetical protein